MVRVWVNTPASSTDRRQARPSTGRRHAKEVLLLHRAGQMHCTNVHGWASRACDDSDYDWGMQIEQQVEQLLEQTPEVDEQSELQLVEQPLQLDKQSDLQTLLIGPPPGLEELVSPSPLAKDAAPIAMTTNAMLASCGCENLSCETAFVGVLNNATPTPTRAHTTPKSSSHICLAECISDTSTVASENSPLLFPRDLIDGGVAHSSPVNLEVPAEKESPRTVPSLVEALSFVPQTVPSLAEALACAPGTPPVAPKLSTPISLDAMLDFGAGKSPISLEATLQEGALKADAWTPSHSPVCMLPNPLPAAGVCPWWWWSMQANSMHGVPPVSPVLSRASSGTSQNEVVLI